MFAIDFDQVEDKKSFDGLPDGEYVGIISSANLKETRDGTGAGINVQIEVTEGLLQGRYHFEWINVANKSPDCVKIGLAQLKQLVVAACLPTDRPFNDPSELHGKIIRFKVKTSKNGNIYTDYKPYGSSVSAAQVGNPAVKGNLVAGQKPAW